MLITTVNVNGIRSAQRKGLIPWISKRQPDVVCLQETRIQDHQLDAAAHVPPGYHACFHHAERPGYAGVAIYSKREPDAVIEGLGMPDIDAEGRYLEARFGRLRVVSLYMHSGSSSEERQAKKEDFMARFEPVLSQMRRSRQHVIICGDWNIAHKQIDLKNWRGNQKNSGFLPQERAWMDKLFAPQPEGVDMVDVFRRINAEPDQYTWWSNRGQAWAKNVGWRIDYHIATPGIARKAVSASIYKDERFSDHAPLTIEYDYALA